MEQGLSERLLRLKRERGLSYRKIAEKAGLGETAVRDIVVGRSRSPKLETLEAIAKALNVSVSYLAAEDDRLYGLREDPTAAFISQSDAIDAAMASFQAIKEDENLSGNPLVQNALEASAILLRFRRQVAPVDIPALTKAIAHALEYAESAQLKVSPKMIATLAATFYETHTAADAAMVNTS